MPAREVEREASVVYEGTAPSAKGALWWWTQQVDALASMRARNDLEWLAQAETDAWVRENRAPWAKPGAP
jgi:hypothetical protein